MSVIVTAIQTIEYRYTIQSDSVTDALKEIQNVAVDHDSLNYKTEVLCWKKPEILNITLKKE